MNTFWRAIDHQIILFPARHPAPAQIISAANLPPAIAATISSIVQATRLRQSERADLAAELCGHFADGLAAGASPEQLIKDFGNPRAAAKLIARAVKRKRSWQHQFLRRSLQAVGVFFLTLILIYVWLFVRFHFRQPNIARNYAAEFNARVTALPESQRGWPAIRAVLPNWIHGSAELRTTYPPFDPASAVWREGVENLHANRANLDEIRRACALPGWGVKLKVQSDPAIKAFNLIAQPDQVPASEPPEVDNPPLISTNLAELAICRYFARTLAFDMKVAAQEKDPKRVIADVRALLGMTRQMREQRILISDLVAAAIGIMCYNYLGDVLDSNPGLFTESELAELAHALAAIPSSGDSFRIRFDAERTSFDDMLQRVYSDDGHGDGLVVAKGMELYAVVGYDNNPSVAQSTRTARNVLGPAASAVLAGRRETKRVYDLYLDRAESLAITPLWQRGETPAIDVEIEQLVNSPIGRARYHLISLLMPALSAAAAQGEYLQQRRDGMIVAVALELYKLKHGSYPATLDPLVPELLPAIPQDRYTGGPILYILKDNKPVVYSVGVDRIDNQGVPPPGPNGNLMAQRFRSPSYVKQVIASYTSAPAPSDIRGDWILYPEPKDPPTPK